MVSPTSKKDFQKTFVKYYLENPGFQKYIANWIILVMNRQFYGIYRTRKEAGEQGFPGDSRHIYVVGEIRTVERGAIRNKIINDTKKLKAITKTFRTITFKSDIIIFKSLEKMQFFPFCDVYKYIKLTKRGYKNDRFNIDYNTSNIYMTTEEMNMIIVADKNLLDIVKDKIYSSYSVYSGYITDYTSYPKIYIKENLKYYPFPDVLDYRELIMPMEHYEIGHGSLII